MAQKEPTEQEQQEFMDKQSKLYDAKEGYAREKDEAIDKGNATMYQEADRKDKEADAEIEKNNDEWNKEHGIDQEQEEEVEQEATQEQEEEIEK